MDNKRQQDIAWKDVPKDKKRRLVIRALIIALCALFAGLLIAGVGGLLRGTAVNTMEQLTMSEEVNLNGIGLDDILSWKAPEGYENPEETVGEGDELVGIEQNLHHSILFRPVHRPLQLFLQDSHILQGFSMTECRPDQCR